MAEINRMGRIFGEGTLVGDKAGLYGFFNLDTRGKALAMAWSHSCNIALEITDPNNETYGPDWMLKRYGSTNFWWGYIKDQAGKKLNKELSNRLRGLATDRREGEKVGIYEGASVPSNHTTTISEMGTVIGYALPRVFIEGEGRGENANRERFLCALEALDRRIEEVCSPFELLALVAEDAVSLGANPKVLLSHIFPRGLLKEQGTYVDYRLVKGELECIEPNTLWQTYKAMPAEEKAQLNIANI